MRQIHRRCAGTKKLSPCAECYLPLKTEDSSVIVGARNIKAEKYIAGTQKVSELQTPEKFKRKDLKV